MTDAPTILCMYVSYGDAMMFIEFCDELINADYILKFNRSTLEAKPPVRPFLAYINLKLAVKNGSFFNYERELFENFHTVEQRDKRYQELVKLLCPSKTYNSNI